MAAGEGPVSAAVLGLLGCHCCGLLSSGMAGHASCTRCGAALHLRKTASLSRTWAYLAAAAIAYVPSNLLPIMRTTSPFGTQDDTIMSGIVYLYKSGSWPLALVVFIASVMVPLVKMFALGWLLVSVERRSQWQPLQRTKLYRLVELIGRWSILDIYVVALLVTLVQLRGLATIEASPGAVAFGAVVVLTMLAAKAFDPRLIWDSLERRHD
jgi:paraquat-inducible protein A